MRPRLYISEICPSAGGVVLTAKALGLTLEIREINETDTIKCNKLHQLQNGIPLLQDSHAVIWDSHAIIAYLVGKYGLDDSLYPSEKDQRAKIDEILLFDSGVISFYTRSIYNPVFYEDNVQAISELYTIAEKFFVGDNKWTTGNELSIADLVLLPSITTLNLIVPIDGKQCPKLNEWIKRAEEMPFYEHNQKELCKLKKRIVCCA